MGRKKVKRREREKPSEPAGKGSAPSPTAAPGVLRRVLGASRGRTALALLALAVAVALAFGGALDNEFLNFDDDRYITKNGHVLDPDAESVGWMLTNTALFYWHPLTLAWHAAEVKVFGLDPTGHHATSLALHALNAALVMALVIAILGRLRSDGPAPGPSVLLGAGFVAALLWAVHPLRVESVAWASEKKDLLSTLFLLGVLHAHLAGQSAATEVARRRWGWAGLAALVLSLAAKPMAMTAPFLLLALDAVPLRRFGRVPLRRLLLEKLPHLLIVIGAVLPSLLDPRQEQLLPGADPGGWPTRLLRSAWGFAFPLVKTVWPSDLVPFVPIDPAGAVTLGDMRYGGSVLLLAVLTIAAIVAWRRGRRGPLVAWAAYLVVTAPVSGLRQAGSVAVADRFAYVPSLVLFLGVASLVPRLLRRVPGRLALGGALAVATALGLLTHRQVEVWRDSETLWTTIVRRWPDRIPVAHNNLGGILHARGLDEDDPALLARAEEQYRAALALDPGWPSTLNNLALIRQGAGDFEEAEALLGQALERNPHFGMAHANLGFLRLRRRDLDGARAALEQAEQSRPLPPRARIEELRAAIEDAERRWPRRPGER